MELFKDEETHNDHGFLEVRCDQPFYEPGSEVTGKVYIRITKAIEGCKGLDFEVKGGAKSSFTRYWYEMEGEGEEARMVERSEKLEKAKKFLGYKDRVGDIPDTLEEGDYTITFSFQLPNKVPSSLMYKNKHSREGPKAKVKYFVKCKINCKDDDMDLKHK